MIEKIFSLFKMGKQNPPKKLQIFKISMRRKLISSQGIKIKKKRKLRGQNLI